MDLKFLSNNKNYQFQLITKIILFLFLISVLTFFTLSPTFAQEDTRWITIESKTLEKLPKYMKSFYKINEVKKNISLLELPEAMIPMLSSIMHREFNVCGGFLNFSKKSEAIKHLENELDEVSNKINLNSYNISEQNLVKELIKNVQEKSIYNTIEKLSSFHNRYYKSQTGLEALQWIFSTWSSIVDSREDISVEYFKHLGWKQPSVILTINGNELKDEVVIVGGHADSISGYFGQSSNRAPGADDNASGIATITEALTVLINGNFKPKRTIKFMAYAAEEVGLLGSKEIAKDYKNKSINVVGVLQLDMTNFKGSNKDIYLISDNTNNSLNKFVGSLIDEYLKISWGYSSCGYACSDHASWHNKDFPASFPFEASKKGMNKKIHTKKDLLDVSGHSADHATNFSKLTVSFLIEMAKSSSNY
jgi:bacterial leucyl aminopeptidase